MKRYTTHLFADPAQGSFVLRATGPGDEEAQLEAVFGRGVQVAVYLHERGADQLAEEVQWLSHVAYIVDLAVPDAWRGRGVGSAVFERALFELARMGVRSVYLHTKGAGGLFDSAVHFCQKHGFELVGEDPLGSVMTRQLKVR